MRLYNHLSEKERQKIEFLLTNNYSIRNIVKELERFLSIISREINNISRKFIGYKILKEFYKSYSKCCISNWNSHNRELKMVEIHYLIWEPPLVNYVDISPQKRERFFNGCYSLNLLLLRMEASVSLVTKRFYWLVFSKSFPSWRESALKGR